MAAGKLQMNVAQLQVKLHALLTGLVGHLAQREKDLCIEVKPLAAMLSVSIGCHAQDAPRIIGKGGAHHKALARILSCIGQKNKVLVKLEAIQAERLKVSEASMWGFKSDQNWDKVGIRRLLLETCRMVFRDGDCIQIADRDDDAQMQTLFFVSVARNEPMELCLAMTNDLNTIFNAIGKRRGRLLQVGVVPELEPETPQPKSAAGRFAKELQ